MSTPDEPRNWFDGDWPTVVIGSDLRVCAVLHLPLYAALERIDGRLIEAVPGFRARRRFQTFLRITLPLSMPGLLAASVIIDPADVR